MLQSDFFVHKFCGGRLETVLVNDLPSVARSKAVELFLNDGETFSVLEASSLGGTCGTCRLVGHDLTKQIGLVHSDANWPQKARALHCERFLAQIGFGAGTGLPRAAVVAVKAAVALRPLCGDH